MKKIKAEFSIEELDEIEGSLRQSFDIEVNFIFTDDDRTDAIESLIDKIVKMKGDRGRVYFCSNHGNTDVLMKRINGTNSFVCPLCNWYQSENDDEDD